MIMTDTAENRRIVQEGLKRRADRHNAFENAMFEAVSKNHAKAKDQRLADTATVTALIVTDEQRKERARARLNDIQARQKQERDASRALSVYMIAFITLMLLSGITPLPFWAAITTACGLGAILAAYLFRIYVPLENETAR